MPFKPAARSSFDSDAVEGLTTGVQRIVSDVATQAQVQLASLGPLPVIFCGVAFVLGLLLCVVGKKFMRIILSLLFGFAIATAVLFGIDFVGIISDPWIMLVTMCVSGLVATFISFRWAWVYFTMAITCALSFGLMSLLLFCFLEENWSVLKQQPNGSKNLYCGIVVVLGGFIGYVLGYAHPRFIMKSIGAVLGSFLVVSSVGYFLDAFVLAAGACNKTSFNLFGFYESAMRGLSDTRRAVCESRNAVTIAMVASWIILCVFSLVYQFCIQPKSAPVKNVERAPSTSHKKSQSSV
eukprot:780586_1